jgi:hypothetical protein
MEYTITTPLLFATAVAAISPTIPTGMVQYVYGSLLASHILTVPVLYVSHIYDSYLRNMDQSYFKKYACAYAIACFLFACAIMQLIGLVVFGMHIFNAGSYYHISAAVKDLVIALYVMQALFVVTVIVSAVFSIVDHAGAQKYGELFSTAYSMLNAAIRLGTAFALAEAARRKDFSIMTCDIWNGSFFMPK